MACTYIPKTGNIGPTYLCGPDKMTYLCFEHSTIRVEYHSQHGPSFWRVRERALLNYETPICDPTEEMWRLFEEWHNDKH